MTVLGSCSLGLRVLFLISAFCLSPMASSTDSAYLADEGVSLGLSLGYGQLDNPVYLELMKPLLY